jgi:Arc/MetJ-type ribon-helix-helix transcriptional regulator
MISFRLSEADAIDVQRWAARLGVDRSELVREALHRHLVRLKSEADAATWERVPRTKAEEALADVADWGPAEDWSDWADAAG